MQLTQWVFALRRPVVLTSALLIAYFVAMVLAMPTAVFSYEFLASGDATVLDTGLRTDLLRVGDVLIAENGSPLRFQYDWAFKSDPFADSVTYTVVRSGQTFDVTLPMKRGSIFENFAIPALFLPLIFAISMWSLGAIALWRLKSETIKVLAAGYTLVLLGLSLVAVSTARNLTPFSLTVMTLFFPTASALFAVLPVTSIRPLSASRARHLFWWFLVPVAILCTLGLAFQVFIFSPQGIYLEAFIGIRATFFAYLFFALALVINTSLTLWGLFSARRQRQSHVFQQYRLLSLAALVSFLPLIFLLILPTVLFPNQYLLGFWAYEFPFITLAIYPGAFLYTAVRYNNLDLDIRVTRFVQGMFLLLIFALGFLVVTGFTTYSRLGPETIASLIFAYCLIGFFVGPRAFRPIWRATQGTLYGGKTHHIEIMNEINALLTSEPNFKNIATALTQLSDVLSTVQPIRLVIRIKDAWVAQSEPAAGINLTASGWDAIPNRVLRRGEAYDTTGAVAELFESAAWLELIVPLATRGEIIGHLLLSKKEALLSYNGHDLELLDKVRYSIGSALNTLELLESSRDLAFRLREGRMRERIELRTKIHDVALKKLSQGEDLLRTRNVILADPVLANSLRVLEDAEQQIRLLLADIPPSAATLGPHELVELAADTLDDLETTIHREISIPRSTVLSDLAGEALYNILEGAVANIRKHAHATEVVVMCSRNNEGILLSIRDNGKGFAGSLSLNDALRRRRYGLANMFDWAHLAGGTLSIESAVGSGTTVCLWLPASFSEINWGVETTGVTANA